MDVSVRKSPCSTLVSSRAQERSCAGHIADLRSGYYPTSNSSASYYHANGVPVPYLWSNKATVRCLRWRKRCQEVREPSSVW